jgi:hypothetical protein
VSCTLRARCRGDQRTVGCPVGTILPSGPVLPSTPGSILESAEAYNLLFRWFLNMDIASDPFDASTFSKDRDRLLEHVAGQFFRQVVAAARSWGVMSDDHFTVGDTLIEAWTLLKSFKAKGRPDAAPPDDPGNPTVDVHGEERSNDTHE